MGPRKPLAPPGAPSLASAGRGKGKRRARAAKNRASGALGLTRHARACPTAVRFDFDRQGAWRGFFCVLSASHTFETREGDHAMLHQNSVFHSLLKHVPWHKLAQSVEKYAADKLSRELTTKRHVIALLYGQFCGAASLREIVTGMASQQTRLSHVGAHPVKRTTLSDANRDRPYQVFGALCYALLE